MRNSNGYRKKFGDVLRKARERAGLNKSDLARLAGVPITSYHEWEHGHSDPSLLKFQPVIAALGCHAIPLLEEIGYAPKR